MIDLSKEAEIMNLRRRMMKAFTENRHVELCGLAQECFDKGYDIDEVIVLPGTRKVMMNILTSMGWKPELKK